MNQNNDKRPDVMYLTVLPFYRQTCIEELVRQTGPGELKIFAGPRQLTASVSTGIAKELYSPLRAWFFINRAILLRDHAKDAMTARTLMLDLNPRCISAWALLVARKVLRRRTIVWGHLYPRAGSGSWTAGLRRSMRSIADGTVLYGFDSVAPATKDVPAQPVWVAPNALYSVRNLGPISTEGEKTSIIYVGRLVAEKKVGLLVEAFAKVAANREGIRLKIVGQGSELEVLRRLASDLGCEERVDFLGSITDPAELRAAYSDSICSVSPGYVGLSLTQSLGFGVPMLIADNEPHAPEVELERFGGVARFTENDPSSLASLMEEVLSGHRRFPAGSELAAPIKASYSSESMARGLLDSLRSRPQRLDETGWPAL